MASSSTGHRYNLRSRAALVAPPAPQPLVPTAGTAAAVPARVAGAVPLRTFDFQLLPSTVLDKIYDALDPRPPCSLLPPPTPLVRLAGTCTFLYQDVGHRVWSRIYYRPPEDFLPRSIRHRRNLRALNLLVEEGSELPIQQIHVDGLMSRGSQGTSTYEAARKSASEGVQLYLLVKDLAARKLESDVLCTIKLSHLVLEREYGELMIGHLALSRIRSLALEDVQLCTIGDEVKSNTIRRPVIMEHLTSLQVLRCDDYFLGLIRHVPRLDSLALDAGQLPIPTEYFGDLLKLLGTLRRLSFKAPGGGEAIRKILLRIITAKTAAHPYRFEELAFEGPLDLAVLAEAASHMPALKRLVLHHFGKISVDLLSRLVTAAPSLEALTLYVGGPENASEWLGDLTAYIPIFARLHHLHYLALDLNLSPIQRRIPKNAQGVSLVTKVDMRRSIEAIGRACWEMSELFYIEGEDDDGLFGQKASLTYHQNTRRLKTTLVDSKLAEMPLLHLEWFESA